MPWQMTAKDTGKEISGVTIYEDDGDGWVKIPSAYTKEDPNGLPEMTKKRVKGKDVWDDSDMMDFLESMAKDWVKSFPQITDEEAAGEKAPF